jgi:LysM repeat protein
VETIKTAIVVVLLLAVLYGVYVVLNKPELAPPPEVAWQQDTIQAPEVELGSAPTAQTADPVGAAQHAVPAAPSLGIVEPGEQAAGGASNAVAGPADFRPQPPPETLPAEPPATAVPDPATVADQEPSAASAQQPVAPATEPVAPTSNASSVAAAPTAPASDPPASQRSIYESMSDASSAGESYPAGESGSFGAPEQPAAGAFESAWRSALVHMEQGQLGEALLTLSLRYRDQQLTGEQRQRMIDLLDPLAGRVIYSNESILEAPYQIRDQETLYDVAQQFQIPVVLLQKINGIANPDAVWPGTTIKVVRGPFRAEVDVQRDELALFLGKYYAGRFAISAGNDPPPQAGEYEVVAKQPGRDYTTVDGGRIAAGAADSPYGNWWIDLGGNMSLHSSPDTIPTHGSFGCIALQPSEAEDVYGILAVGSKVLIR